MIVLLDSSVLIATVVANHQFHESAHRWFSSAEVAPATCPITQGTLLRFLLQQRLVDSATAAWDLLSQIQQNPRHRFLPDTIDYLRVPTRGLLGQRQVTDAYLAQLARAHGVRLATFDQGLATMHPDVSDLISVN